MSTQRERDFIDRIDRIVKECATLYPKNPADTKAYFSHAPVIHDCLGEVTAAIGCLRFADYESGSERLAIAERRLEGYRHVDLDRTRGR